MRHKYLKNVSTLSLNADDCVGCGKCVKVCPHTVFEVHGGKAEVVEKDFCMECGACALNCPVNAIEVDSGTGCALAFIIGWLTGKDPSCGSNESDCC